MQRFSAKVETIRAHIHRDYYFAYFQLPGSSQIYFVKIKFVKAGITNKNKKTKLNSLYLKGGGGGEMSQLP